jgi:hypothetical protein
MQYTISKVFIGEDYRYIFVMLGNKYPHYKD